MKNLRDDLEAGSREPLLREGHLTEEGLLLLLDGELSPPEREQAKTHVDSCWSCRARRDALARSTADFADYQNAFLAPHMPPPPSGKPMFMARLDELAEELGRPSLFRIWRRAITEFSQLLLATRMVWITVALLIVLAAPLFYLFQKAPVVSANELLHRASVAEAGTPMGVDQPVVIQKLSIEINGRKMTQTVYRDTVRKRQAHRTNVNASEELSAERAFHQSSFSWDDPLSPQTYSSWRDGIEEKRDAVTQLSGGLLKLDTTTNSGPVAEASITVRADDYHPVAEDLHLRDNTQIEIAELSYEVVSLSTLAPDIFGAPASTEPLGLPATSANLSFRTALPDAAQLAVSELQVQAALHSIGADLGEQITVQQGADGRVQVDGVAADEARKRQIATALVGIPYTELRVKTIAQVAVLPQPGSAPSKLNLASSTTVAVANPPLLERQLKQRFPDGDQRMEYVNQSLALCQSASARAWALNRLADRYTPEQITLLDNGAQQQLQRLLSDHISALREDVSRLQSQLGQVLSSSSNTAAANTAPSRLPPPKTSESADDWRSHIHRVHSSVETVNESVAVLLTGSAGDEKDDPETIEVGLRTTLTQLQAELQVLDQQVHKQF